MGGAPADAVVDVTDQLDRKIAALLAHESQHPDPSGMTERVRGWLGATAAAHHLPEGRLAEAFQVVTTG